MELSVDFVLLCKWFDCLKKDTLGGVCVPVLTRIVVIVCWAKFLDVPVWLLTAGMKIGVTPSFLEMGITGCISYVN